MPVLTEATDTGDGDGDGETFSFGIDAGRADNSIVRQQTSAELLAALGSSALDDQEKIATFISRLKDGDIATKKSSEFRKRRLTYEQKTTEKADAPPSAAAQAALQAAGIGGTAAAPVARAKRTAIFASSEIGSRQEKKPPFPPHLMGTFSCHGKSL
jgi:hypothetical protein